MSCSLKSSLSGFKFLHPNTATKINIKLYYQRTEHYTWKKVRHDLLLVYQVFCQVKHQTVSTECLALDTKCPLNLKWFKDFVKATNN